MSTSLTSLTSLDTLIITVLGTKATDDLKSDIEIGTQALGLVAGLVLPKLTGTADVSTFDANIAKILDGTTGLFTAIKTASAAKPATTTAAVAAPAAASDTSGGK